MNFCNIEMIYSGLWIGIKSSLYIWINVGQAGRRAGEWERVTALSGKHGWAEMHVDTIRSVPFLVSGSDSCLERFVRSISAILAWNSQSLTSFGKSVLADIRVCPSIALMPPPPSTWSIIGKRGQGECDVEECWRKRRIGRRIDRLLIDSLCCAYTLCKPGPFDYAGELRHVCNAGFECPQLARQKEIQGVYVPFFTVTGLVGIIKE